MILKTVVTEDTFSNLMVFLRSEKNELTPQNYPEIVDLNTLRLCVIEKPTGEGPFLSNKIMDEADSVSLTRLVQATKFRYGGEAYRFGYEIVLEIGQTLSGCYAQHWVDGSTDLVISPDCLNPLFEILFNYSIERDNG